jgi:transcriptional regulator with XRE-family HTH domain
LNETLCRALLLARLSEEDVAARLQVDPKTVRRWLEGRVPYLRHRWALAAMVGLSETDLWPQLRGAPSRPEEVQTVYPHLDAVPEDVWLGLFSSAEHEIGVLADTAEPIAGYPRVLEVLAEKTASGVSLRICMIDRRAHDADRSAVAQAGRIASAGDVWKALGSLAALSGMDGVEIRVHRGVTYNAIYHAEDDVLVAQSVHGFSAGQAPVLHLRSAEQGGMAAAYRGAFARFWSRGYRVTG